MGMEIPMVLIGQLQTSLRREAKLSSYDPGGASSSAFPSLPSAADAIAELDASPSYLRCRNCKGKLLRGIDSLICVFCGKQQRTTDNPPDPIKFTSTCGYRWLLGSLNLDGSEMVEPPKEMNGSGRGRNALVEGTSISKLLDLEIQWSTADEKLANSGLSDGKSVQSRVPLDLGGLDLGNFFVEGRGTASDVQIADSNPVEDDFKDPRSLSLFENVESQGFNALQQHENVSLFKLKDAEESSSSTEEHENLSLFVGQDVQRSVSLKQRGNPSLFDGGNAEESISSKGHEEVDLFEGKDAQGSVSSKEEGKNLSLFEGVPLANSAVGSVDDKSVNSSADWNIDLQSADEDHLSQEQNCVAPFGGSSVDLSAHMDTLFGSGKDPPTASVSSAGDWIQDDLFANAIHQAKKSNAAVHERNEGQMSDKNATSSMNIDWIQDDLWQTSGKHASERTYTDEDDDWNDFASSANSKKPAEDEKQTIEMSMMPDETKDQEVDLFGSWNDFTSTQYSTDHVKSSIKQTSQTNIFGDFLQSDFFSEGFSSQNNPADIKILQPTSNLTSDRMTKPASKDQKLADSTSSDLFEATSKSKADAGEELMLQMHDLSFMLESKLSVPSNSKMQEF